MTCRPRILPLVVVLAALTAAPAAGAASLPAWDATPLTLAGPLYEAPRSGPVVEITDDGAVWVAWLVYDAAAGATTVTAQRISPDGVPGEQRVLLSSAFTYSSGQLAIAPLPGDEVRVVYAAEESGELGLRMRRLGPQTTGEEIPLFTPSAGDGVRADSVRLLAGPGSATWVTFQHGSGPSTLSARRIADDGTLSSRADLPQQVATYDAAVNPTSGRLVLLPVVSSSNGRVAAVRVTTAGTIDSTIEPRAPLAGTDVDAPSLAMDGSGVATATWRMSPPLTAGRAIETARFGTSNGAALDTPGPVTRIDETPGQAPVFGGPLAAADPAGTVLAIWPQWTSATFDFTDSFLRRLPGGALTTSSGLPAPAPLGALTGTTGGVPSDLVPGADGIFTAHYYVQAPNNDGALTACRVARITTTGGVVDDHVLAASGCGLSVGPAIAAGGNVAVWTTIDGLIRLSRVPASAPQCGTGAPVSVTAGATVTVPLPCSGWRPVRGITAQPGRGTLGVVDDTAGTVAYTAGSAPGPDSLTYRAANGAGTSLEATVPITVTAAPEPQPQVPASPAAPGADVTVPVISQVRLSPRLVVRTRPRTPTLRFTLSEAATVTVTLERLVPGRRVGGACRPVPARGRRPGARCTRAVVVSKAVRKAPAGEAKLAIAVRQGRRVVAAGSYRLTVAARDAAGNAAVSRRAALVVAAR